VTTTVVNRAATSELGSPAAGQRLHALLVEEDERDAASVVDELRRGGYDVSHARVSSLEALRDALVTGRWDVVLAEGPWAADVLRALGLDTPFIVVSRTRGEAAAVAAMRGGASGYVLKDDLASLCPAVQRELREAAERARQRRQQEQVLISDRLAYVGTLAAGVAHEINNPLAAICANLELAAAAIDDLAQTPGIAGRLDDVIEEVRDARACAERVRLIVRDLKVFSRAPDEERRGPVDVNRVLETSLRLAWSDIRHRARLVKELGVLPPVDANEARLGQVFLDLITNAAQAIPAGDVENNVIRVRTALAPAGRVVIEVSDTGAGIEPQDLARIFDAFYTTKGVGAGRGLGLSICHRIVRGLGGEILVESAPGRGTTFRVSLPQRRADALPRIATPVPPPAPRRGRVLIIDDEVAFARALARILAGEHDVELSASAGDALARLRAGETFDVIVCDLMMPQMTGMDLHAELARLSPELAARVVFVTGGAFTEDARVFLSAVPNRRIEKPFGARELRAVIAERLR
jgi:signal transduction histidine kinase